MNRRQTERVTKRVEVQFWQPSATPESVGHGALKVLRGFSTNVSASGMHIATPTPLPAQSRLRIEVLYGGRGFVIEGVVAHRRAVHPELAKVTPSGMGVRFLRPEELVRELFPRDDTSGMASPVRGAGRDAAAAATHAGGGTGAGIAGEERTFAIRFDNARDFLAVYRRDILNGGLFVASSRPARVREVVRLDIFPPGPAAAPIQLAARVVQRFPPQPGSGSLEAGMGLELLDMRDAVARLQPIADRLAKLID